MATIYLADRDAPYRKQLAYSLRKRGTEVVEFASGAELFARTVEHEPDLVVTETELDEVDGFQVFAWLLRRRSGKDGVPIVFHTRFDNPGVAHACKQQGALDYVGKNQPLELVVEKIMALTVERDPLETRNLPAALAWLQSRGKSGRIDISACGEHGHILLHKGKIIEARLNAFEGDQALKLFTEVLLGAAFRFAEGMDEVGMPQAGDRLAGTRPDLPIVMAEPSPSTLVPLVKEGNGKPAPTPSDEGKPAGAAPVVVNGGVVAEMQVDATGKAAVPETPPDATVKAVVAETQVGLEGGPVAETQARAASDPVAETRAKAVPEPAAQTQANAASEAVVPGVIKLPPAGEPASPWREGTEPASPWGEAARSLPEETRATLRIDSRKAPNRRAVALAALAACLAVLAVLHPELAPVTSGPSDNPEMIDRQGSEGGAGQASSGRPTPVEIPATLSVVGRESAPLSRDTEDDGGQSEAESATPMPGIESGGPQEVSDPAAVEAPAEPGSIVSRRGVAGPAISGEGRARAGRAENPPSSLESGEDRASTIRQERTPARALAAGAGSEREAAGVSVWRDAAEPIPSTRDTAPAARAPGPKATAPPPASELAAAQAPAPSSPSSVVPSTSVAKTVEDQPARAPRAEVAFAERASEPADSPPTPTSPVRFRYPRELADEKVGGAVTLRVLVAATGQVETVQVLRSSGHPKLDSAAIDAVRATTFRAGRRAGRPVATWIEQRVLGLCCRSEAGTQPGERGRR